MKNDEIRVGVVGIGRGISFAECAKVTGMKLVALCDTWKEKLYEYGRDKNIALYTDYDEFLNHDMDAVILANYFHEHAPFAIKALKAGKHVLSETVCNITLAEGVALCRAVEETGRIYMLAENYPYTKFNQELKRIYASGEIGRVTYAEGEYNHPMSPRDRAAISPGANHWRNWLPSTYYCTHALAPLMHITDTLPVCINALSIAAPEVDKMTMHIGDPGSVILCRMDNGAVFRLFGVLLPGHSNWYRIHGTRGAAEITRGPGYFGPEQVRVWHEEWDLLPGELKDRVYSPNWPDHGDLANRAGHGGGDFWVELKFAEAILSGKQPYFDVYRGVTMSSVGILAWKSALREGTPIDMPDFREESSRKLVEDDYWSPFPNARHDMEQPPPSLMGIREPTIEGREYYKSIWREIGYTGE